MNAIKVTEKVVSFPKVKPTKEIKVMSFVNCPNIRVREERAREYSASCKQICKRNRFAQFERKHEDLLLLASGFSVFAGIIGVYFIMVCL